MKNKETIKNLGKSLKSLSIDEMNKIYGGARLPKDYVEIQSPNSGIPIEPTDIIPGGIPGGGY